MHVSRLALLLAAFSSAAQAAPGFFRSPAISGDTIVFTAEGDLWKVAAQGGEARRLTSHPGVESAAAISPDGKLVAFSAQYEGPTEVYVMPLDGGLPKRLTWHGEGAAPVGWTPDGKVLCATRAYSTLPNTQLVALQADGSGAEVLPLAQASDGALNDSGKSVFFTRLPFQGSQTKRYQGGTAQNLWRYDEGAQEAVALTPDFPGTSKNPMWWNGRLYFISDRSGVANLWSMLPDGSDLKALTQSKDYEVRNARMDRGRIVYQQAGAIRVVDTKDGSDREIPVTLPSDFDQTRERWVSKPMEYLTSARLSPDGDRLVLTARGGVFVVPVKPGGRLVELPRKPGVRYREASFLPDGKNLLVQTDETGEIEMAKLPANGVGAPELLTEDGAIFRFAPVASPDGKWIAWQDKNLQLWVRDLTAKKTTLVRSSKFRGFDDLTWSPDGRWLAFVENSPNTNRVIMLYNVAAGTFAAATTDRVSSSSPTWSPDGKWLYFLSDRTLRSAVKSPWGPRQPEPYFTESTRIYALALQKGLRSPFEPADELHPASGKDENKDKPKDSPAKDGAAPAAPAGLPEIDVEGLAARLFDVPGVIGNLSNLHATGKNLFFSSMPGGLEAKPRIMRLEITPDSPEAKVFSADAGGWDISDDGKKIMIRKGEAFYVVPVEGEAKLDKPVPLDRWSFHLDPREEWRQIYRESWRMLRDYFYDPAMHGTDWVAIRNKYEPLVERVADRSDLSEVMQEMSGELSALHIYVQFGDLRTGPDTIQPSSLGARLGRDAAGWKVEHVFATDPDYPGETSPLARPGVEVKDGDVIVSINGRTLQDVAHPEELLARQAGQQVLLEIQPAGNGARRSVLVEPLSVEAARDLRYSEWEYTRRLQTEELGKGDIGYVHLRSMGPESIIEWARNFYPVYNRQGLIIDLRHNRGGNTDSWFLSRLMRKAWFHWAPRVGEPYPNMQYAFSGHAVVLCNEWTASDGEAFSEGFRRLGLGKVIGTRTWGGQIWLDSRRWLIDNGMCSAAEIGVFGPEGKWLIEGHGVEPDVVVDNGPHSVFQGRDLQLEAAVKHLQDLIAKQPRPQPVAPAYPDKSGR